MKIYWRAAWPGGLYLVGAVLMPLMAGAQTAQTPAAALSAATSVAQVDIARNGQQTTVRVESGAGSSPLSYHVLRLSDPARVVVDFDHAHLSVSRSAIPSNYQPVNAVRLSQFRPDQVRLVIDLDHRVAYSVENSEQAMAVKFDDAAPASIAASTQIAPKMIADPQPVAKAQTNAGRVRPAATTAAREFPLPATLTGGAASLASPVPQTVAAMAKGQPTLSAAVQAPAGPGQQAVPQGQAGYSGEPISVNLKDVDLKDFFRLIHEISGLNVVLDPSVQGRVTLVLDEVPWDQALEIVMRNNGLAKEITGNVLRIASQDTLRKEAENKRDLAKAEAEAVDPVTTTRVLSYSKASEITNTLKRFLSSRGEIISDDRSNSLIIRDIPASMPQIDDLIRQLDRKTQQVGIEARVVSASRSFARDIGTQFGMSTRFGNNLLGGSSSAGTSPVTTNITPPFVAAGTSSLPLITNFAAGAPTSGLTFINRSPNFALDYLITAAESKGVGKLLSSPQLVTQNNAKAIVKQGTKVPIQTTINNTVSVQYIDAVLQLQVTPQITADGTIFMDVLVENTQIDPGIARVQGIPALNTQSAETKVLINDGGTVVIGGVMTSTQTTTVNQVPVVGSVPLIGHLFKRTAVSVSSQELLFFLTPRILPG